MRSRRGLTPTIETIVNSTCSTRKHPPVNITISTGMSAAQHLCLVACGVFFLTGLLTGAWKYACIATRDKAEAPYYVSIAHRAALMYTFAALVLWVFAGLSKWDDTVNFWAAFFPLLYFALAIATYILHGFLEDTDNQFRRPHRLGRGELPGQWIGAFMVSLAVAEIGGFVVLFAGYLATI